MYQSEFCKRLRNLFHSHIFSEIFSDEFNKCFAEIACVLLRKENAMRSFKSLAIYYPQEMY